MRPHSLVQLQIEINLNRPGVEAAELLERLAAEYRKQGAVSEFTWINNADGANVGHACIKRE